MNDDVRGALGDLVGAIATLVGVPREALPFAVSPERVEGQLPELADHAALARIADGFLNRLMGMDISIPTPVRGPRS